MTLNIKPVGGGAAAPATQEQIDAVKSALGINLLEQNNADIEQAITTLTAGLATKEDPLTFGAGLTRVGDTITLDEPAGGEEASGGNLLDGLSWWMLPGAGSLSVVGLPGTPSLASTAYSSPPVTGGTNTYTSRLRAKLTAPAGTGNKATVYVKPENRFASDNSGNFGLKWKVRFAAADALTNAHMFVGINQHGQQPATGTHPSAYAGQRFGLQVAGDDANRWFKLMNGTTLIKDLGANFPCDGNETNPIDFEIESIPNASGQRTTKWKIKHVLTEAEDSGELVGTGPQGNFEINAVILRDSNGSATLAAFTTTGMLGGGFTNVGSVVSVTGGGGGGGEEDTSVTRAVAASGPLLPTDVNVVIRTTSATPIQLTLPSDESLGITPGKATFSIYNEGAGAVTVVAQNGVTPPSGTAPSGVQGSFIVLTHVGNKWVYPQ